MNDRITSVGLISDTHGLLRDTAIEALRGAELLIHAGDVGKPEVLTALRELAPVIVVKGNIDRQSWSSELPATATVRAGTATIYVLHDIKELDLDPLAAGFQIVVSGHTHKPSRVERSGVLYINPGSAGPRRFQLPTTVARLDLAAVPFNVTFVDVSGDSNRR